MNIYERNQMALAYEKQKEIDKAIELYEFNIQLKEKNPHPIQYKRLTIIYRRKKDNLNLLRILKLYLVVEEQRVKDASPRSKPEKEQIVEGIRNEINKIKLQ
jgi:hypothetical protein